MVHENGFSTPSIKVYFSSPNDYSYTNLANPKSSTDISSTELSPFPPQASGILSMFLLFALLIPIIPFLARISKEGGSIPF